MSVSNHHGTCILVGRKAVLLRGPSGAGKSRLALRLLNSKLSQGFTRLVADDQVLVQANNGRLLGRPPNKLAGLLEVRGIGLKRFPFEARAQIGLIAELVVAEVVQRIHSRLPEKKELFETLEGVVLPSIHVDPADPFAPDRVRLAMACVGNSVENSWQGLAEIDELVLSVGH